MANSADTDQMLHAASDLSLHCLLRPACQEVDLFKCYTIKNGIEVFLIGFVCIFFFSVLLIKFV